MFACLQAVSSLLGVDCCVICMCTVHDAPVWWYIQPAELSRIQQIAKCSGLCSQASQWHLCWAYLSCLFSVPGSIGVLFWLWAVVAAPQPSPRRWNYAPVLQHSHQLFCYDLGMDQYLLIPFLGGWTSIYQLFWCSPGVQGFDTLPFVQFS